MIRTCVACPRPAPRRVRPGRAPAPAPVENAVAAAPAPKAAVPSLEGQWRLTDPALRSTLVIAGSQATLVLGVPAPRLHLRPGPQQGDLHLQPGGQQQLRPLAQRGRGRRLFGALADANLAVFGADGAATLSGTGGMIALQPR